MTLRARLTAAFLAVVLGPVLLGAVFVGATVATVSHARSVERLDLAVTGVRTALGAAQAPGGGGHLDAVDAALGAQPAGVGQDGDRRARRVCELPEQSRVDPLHRVGVPERTPVRVAHLHVGSDRGARLGRSGHRLVPTVGPRRLR